MIYLYSKNVSQSQNISLLGNCVPKNMWTREEGKFLPVKQTTISWLKA